MTTTILATVTAKPEFASDVESALKKMVPTTRNEAGCVSYALFSSKDKAGVFHLVETYIDDAALASHHQSTHFAELVANLATKLACGTEIERINALDA